MNSESPFRISSAVLTAACILCGIAAASYLFPRLNLFRNSVDQTRIAASSLQVNLSEFRANASRVQRVAQAHQSSAASKSLPLPGSNSPATTSVSATLLKTQSGTPKTDLKNTSSTSLPDSVRTTTIQRSASPWGSAGHSIPQFYAPVTVHPVTVNIDNAGIIREISRVHERLDLLSAEARSAGQSELRLNDAATTPTVPSSQQKYDAPATESSSQQRDHDEDLNPALALNQTETDRPHVTEGGMKTVPKLNPAPTRLPTTPPYLPSASPVAEATFEAPPAPLPVTQPSVPVFTPVATIAVTPNPAEAPESMAEIQFEMTPSQPVPEIPILAPPVFVPPAEVAGSLPAMEFSIESCPVPEPTNTRESTLKTEKPFSSFPASEFVEPISYTAPETPVPQPEWPGIATLTDPASPYEKCTTDPPFMRGLKERIPTPPAQTAKASARGVQRVSHGTLGRKPHVPPSGCRNSADKRQATNDASSTKEATPWKTLHRIKSVFSF